MRVPKRAQGLLQIRRQRWRGRDQIRELIDDHGYRPVVADPDTSRGRRDPSSESAGPDIEDSARYATPPPVQATAADEAAARPPRPEAPAPPPHERPAQPEEPDHDDSAPSALTGMDLIQRTLGGQVIEEIGDA